MNLRQHAMRFIGQPIVAHHVNGTIHRGILHKVDDAGIYIRRFPNRVVSSELKNEVFHTAEGIKQQDVDPCEVFFGFGGGFGFGAGLGFIPWGGLGGFWGGGFWI